MVKRKFKMDIICVRLIILSSLLCKIMLHDVVVIWTPCMSKEWTEFQPALVRYKGERVFPYVSRRPPLSILEKREDTRGTHHVFIP
jgi:hypothetical protein